ncbi:hypothetical protein AKJ09_03216 [Labilithrix luteola]|uniref:Lipoprotein n=1 Tax=Labilithrix luteola TaxID=1391654 RepID=A0A0K1PSQ9_9BACT|nr:hypothetical protein [Labilithrix luteola]AKU96552.1 hypothetical protein AKJ09_03216 [Labilithrix luteola]
MTRSGRNGSLLAVLLLSAACSNSERAPAQGTDEQPLSAVITHEERIVRPDGVTQTMRYQERMVRADGRVWIERVVDPRHAQHEDDAHGTKHVHDWGSATRFVTRDAKADAAGSGAEAAHLQFVLPHERQLVAVVPAEYDSVGFYPVWSEIAHLVSDVDRAALQPSKRVTAKADTRWLERQDGDKYVRVLWSDRLHLALEAEAGKSDGTVVRSLHAEVEPVPAALPWSRLEGYAVKDVNDFRD